MEKAEKLANEIEEVNESIRVEWLDATRSTTPDELQALRRRIDGFCDRSSGYV